MLRRPSRVPALALVVLGLVTLTACAGARPRLEGAWECVQPAPAPGHAPVVKVLADGHFSFGAQAWGGQQLWAGGGTYVHAPQAGTYTETVTYHWSPALVGQVIAFECVLEGELWRHRATVDAGGQAFTIDEVWRRISVPEAGK